MDAAPGIAAIALVVGRRPLAIGACGLRFSRTTCDFFVASRTVGPAPQRLARSAASTSRPRRSSASPGWCWPSAPTCSGTPSAGPPATWCCSSSSPPRCAARAPTRCPTSPRRGSGSRGVRAACSVLVVADRLALPDAAVPGRGPDPAARRPVAPDLGRRRRRRPSSCWPTCSSGGMRSITFVQAFQYWLKLTALLVPAVVLLVRLGAATRPPDGRRGSRRLVGAAGVGSARRASTPRTR